MKNFWNEILFLSGILTVFVCAALNVSLGWTLLYVTAVLMLPIGHRDFKAIEEECGSEGLIKRFWAWLSFKRFWAWFRKTYDWRDIRDFMIMPVVLAIAAATCEFYFKLSERTVMIGIAVIAVPVIFVHEWKDYKKHFPKK
jgi:hypothetical protein